MPTRFGRTPAGCHGCRHFQVTYDSEWPYVCEVFGLRSRRLPSLEVVEASGQPCLAREERPAPPSRRPKTSSDDGTVWA